MLKKAEETVSPEEPPDDYLADLTPKQVRVIPLLAVGAAATYVSEVTGVSPGQMSEWRKSRTFMRALAEARRNVLRNTEQDLVALTHTAIETLRELMLNSSSELVRLRAASVVFARLDALAEREPEEGEIEGYDLREVLSVIAVQ